ncbi:hypothetical protein EN829_042805, partial [Mesorhizobium sp. M00.F.Ca.ET.186.01.1.1]
MHFANIAPLCADFDDLLAECVRTQRGSHDGAVLGSLISSQAADKMEELVTDAVAKGARLVA